MNAVRVIVSPQLLREVLSLPADAEITHVVWNDFYQGVGLVVEHPSFTESDEMKISTPLFEKRGSDVVFLDWGIEK